jgi:hypothetical protein
MFRDALRIGQLASVTASGPEQSAELREVLSYFDQAGVIRPCQTGLAKLVGGRASEIVAAARAALSVRDPQRIHAAAHSLRTAAEDAATRAASDTLVIAGIVINAPQHAVAAPKLEHAA